MPGETPYDKVKKANEDYHEAINDAMLSEIEAWSGTEQNAFQQQRPLQE